MVLDIRAAAPRPPLQRRKARSSESERKALSPRPARGQVPPPAPPPAAPPPSPTRAIPAMPFPLASPERARLAIKAANARQYFQGLPGGSSAPLRGGHARYPQHPRPHRRRHLGGERPRHLPRPRRPLGGPSGRGRRDARGVRARSRAGPRFLRRAPRRLWHRSSPMRRTRRWRGSTPNGRAGCSSSPRMSTTCTSAPERGACSTCTAS